MTHVENEVAWPRVITVRITLLIRGIWKGILLAWSGKLLRSNGLIYIVRIYACISVDAYLVNQVIGVKYYKNYVQ